MLDPARLPLPLRRVLGHLEHAALRAVGRLSDRYDLVYALDARLSTRRRLRNMARCEAADRADPTALRWHEHSWHSQNGEDGVIAEVFARVGTTNRHAIEVGASDGEENCTRHLVDSGWTAHWIEADPDKAATAATVAPSAITVIAEAAYRDTCAPASRRSAPASWSSSTTLRSRRQPCGRCPGRGDRMGRDVSPWCEPRRPSADGERRRLRPRAL